MLLKEEGGRMLKKYKAVFFDWDGTAVMSRKAPVEEAVKAMAPLLDEGVKRHILFQHIQLALLQEQVIPSPVCHHQIDLAVIGPAEHDICVKPSHMRCKISGSRDLQQER